MPDVPCQFGPAPEPPAMVCKSSGESDGRVHVRVSTHLIIAPAISSFAALVLSPGSKS